ncbi:hypothetical protein [Candidatus Ruminimicrobiellum ovillum]|uniref:hypothetical protein n=1 Tax=Candidatus Ruminimicrobiellum ovillum TaxID=1947927 RepID=UPI00355A7D74
MLKKIVCFLLSIFILSSCGVTFPKETLEQDAVKLIKEETQKDTSVYRYGSTLYLDVCFEDLVTNDARKISAIYDTLQKIVSTVVRIPLSSDADIKFVVVSAFDPNYQTLLRLFENVDDIKKYANQYISREDYSERQLMEFEGPDRTKGIIENKYDITEEEYVARLIISQLNNGVRTNPFLAKLVQALELRFSRVENNIFYFAISKNIDNEEVKKILKMMLETEILKDIQKYKLFSVKSAILRDEENNIIFSIPVKV